MVARTAYTQLGHSPLLLAGTCLGMAVLFLAPPILVLNGNVFAGVALLLMCSLYLPMTRFYKLPGLWALSLPVAAALYVFATLDSARLHRRGRGGQWKGRWQSA